MTNADGPVLMETTVEQGLSEFAAYLKESEPGVIEWSSLRGRVYYLLREAIVSGRVPPGAGVTLRGLATVLGTSMMPVREAVMRLVAEGAIELNPNRTFTVVRLSPARFIEIRDIRIEVEGWAVELAATRISEEEIHDLQVLQSKVEAASKALSFSYLTWNRRFHFAIYKATRMPELVGMIESLWLKYGPVLNYFSIEDDARLRGNEAHKFIVDPLRQRNGALARQALAADITTSSEVILPRLSADYKESLAATRAHSR